eukprot:s520_g35.t1
MLTSYCGSKSAEAARQRQSAHPGAKQTRCVVTTARIVDDVAGWASQQAFCQRHGDLLADLRRTLHSFHQDALRLQVLQAID